MRQRAIVGRHIQQLLDRIGGIRSNAIHVQRFIGLDGMRCLSILVKRQLKRVATHVFRGVLHFGMQRFTRRSLYRELEIKRFVGISGRIETLGHIERLRNRQRSRNFNRQLAVVAQMRNNRRRGRGRRLAVPLRVQHVSRRAGDIFRLRLREFIDIRQTCRAGLEIGIAIGIVRNGARELLSRAIREADDLGFLDSLAAFVHLKEGVLVVERLASGTRCLLRRLHARFIRINGRIAREVVIRVALGRIEMRNGITQRGTRGECVRVEIHLAVFGVGLDIFRHGFIGVRNKRKRIGFNARREENAQRIRIAHRHGARSFVHVEVAQRNKARGNLHLNLIAHRHIARFRHGNHDIAQAHGFAVELGRACKCVGVGGIGRGFRHVAKHVVIHHNRLERVNLHVGAQRVVERDVAIAHLKALARIGGIARTLHDFLRDVFEDFRKVAGARSRLVEVGTFSASAEVPVPLATPPALRISIGSCREIARSCLHELVFVGGSRGIHIGARVRAIKNADGIHRGALILHGLCSRHGIRGDLIREVALGRRRTIGEENHNLLSIIAVGGLSLRKLHTSSRIRSACRIDGVDGVFKRALRCFVALRHALHDLAVVIRVPAIAIRVVADLICLLTGELHDRNLMLFRRIGNARILRCDLVDERIRGILQRVDAFSASHVVVHRPRRIEHEHDVERRGRRRRDVRRRREHRKRRNEIGIALRNRSAHGARNADIVSRYRFVGPNTTDVLGRIFDDARPIAHRRRVGDRFNVCCRTNLLIAR